MEVLAVTGIGEVRERDKLSDLITAATELLDGDVVVVTSKVVSKAEGRMVPCDRSDQAAREQLIRQESVRILRQRGPLFITETTHGFICANAGIDFSNVEPGHAVLLPNDPDNTAHKIRNAVAGKLGVEIAVVISDTFGRTWRNGATDVAIGCAGLTPLLDLKGTVDTYGNRLESTEICLADEIASAASLVVHKTAQTPVAIVRGLRVKGNGSIRNEVIRTAERDLFR